MSDSVEKLVSDLIVELMDRGCTMTWNNSPSELKVLKVMRKNNSVTSDSGPMFPKNISDYMRKYTYNTNLRHIDDMGEDLELKTVAELCEELNHCGSSLILSVHRTEDGSDYLYYDKE